jgi:hypothetical protein
MDASQYVMLIVPVLLESMNCIVCTEHHSLVLKFEVFRVATVLLLHSVVCCGVKLPTCQKNVLLIYPESGSRNVWDLWHTSLHSTLIQ